MNRARHGSPGRPCRRRVTRILVSTFGILLLMSLPAVRASGSRGAPEVSVLAIEGVINPLAARYLSRELKRSTGAQLVVVRLNTRGGLEGSMRAMVEAMQRSAVPVAVFVSPAGARATSAGMFLVTAAHVAVMAPGTEIGADYPVASRGRSHGGEADKAVRDAGALARAIAEARGRPAEWLEAAVREGVSVPAARALEEGVIDLMESDLEGLLGRLDGRRVTTAAGELTLATAGARVTRRSMRLDERVFATVMNPNIAYLFFVFGLSGLALGLFRRGFLVPAMAGVAALSIALLGFANLPVSWVGLSLIVVAVGLFTAEIRTRATSILGIAGLVGFLVGSLILYTPLGPGSPLSPELSVSPWLVGILGSIAGAVLAVMFLRRPNRSALAAAMAG